jgi:hypothetical protein
MKINDIERVNFIFLTLLFVHADRPQNSSVSIITNTTVRSPKSTRDPHQIVLKMAPASIGGEGCGSFKEVNRPSPEADRHILLVCRLRIRVCGAVPKLPNTSTLSGV